MVRRNDSKGFGLAALLLMALLIATFAAVTGISINQRLAAVSTREQQLKAKYVSMAGLEMTLRRLQDDETLFSPNGTWSSDDDPTLALSDPTLKFEVEVYNNRTTDPVTAPDGTELAPRHAWIQSTAIIDGQRMNVRLGQATKRAVQPLPHFLHALRVTHHSPQFRNTTFVPKAGSPPGTKADVRLEEGAWFNVANFINGDLVYPSESEFVPAWSDYTLTGVQRVEEKNYPKLQFRPPKSLESAVPAGAPSGGVVSPGRYGTSNFTSDVTLLPGDYFFFRFRLGPNLRLNLAPSVTPSNPVRIYVDNDYIIGNNSKVNEGGDPRSLGIFGIKTGDVWWDHEIDLGNDSEHNCVIAASQDWTMPTFPVRRRVTVNGALILGFVWEFDELTVNYDPVLLDDPIEARTDWVLLNDGEG